MCGHAEQDKGLDQLSLALRRQAEVGLTIQGEVDDQNCKRSVHIPCLVDTHTLSSYPEIWVGLGRLSVPIAVLIDDIHQGAEVADTKVRSQTRRIEQVRRKDSCRCTCGKSNTVLYIQL